MEGCGQESSRFLVGSRPSGTARQRAASRKSLRRGAFGRRRKRMWSFAFAIPQFSRAFRKAVGIPPHRWVIQERITLAKTLLRNAPTPLSEVALACGFSDQSHFTRYFSALVGINPRVWRRSVGG